MPELPEAENICRALKRALSSEEIVKVEIFFSHSVLIFKFGIVASCSSRI